MKAHVFISVLAFHVVVIAGLYLLSACSSSSGPALTSEQTGASPAGGSIYDEYAAPNRPVEDDNMVITEVESQFERGIDPVFNSGSNSISSSPTNADGTRSQPRRPGDSPYSVTQQPMLNEDLREEAVLQPLSPVDTTPAVEYQVQKGDSLWKISRDFGISLKDLLVANGLNEKSTINVGQNIIIPSETSGPPAPSSIAQSAPITEVYTIVKGDTLSKIARRFNTNISAIKVANGLTSDVIQLGQRLTIPVGESATTNIVTSSPAPSAPQQPSAPVASGVPSDDVVTHVVQSGETPGGIAKLYGITTTKLMSDNGIKDARSMRVGQSLKIQLGVAQPSTSPAPTVPPSQPVSTPNAFDDFGDLNLDEIPEVEVVPRS